MRYLVYLASSFIAIAIFYYSLIFALFPTPVAAEYWVRELLVFKRDIAKNLAGQPKIIVASGSSTLFNVDTNILSAALKRPTINLGLMGGLPLDTILEEINTVSGPGDLVIMALEPDYYCREANPGYDPWQIRNAIAWNHRDGLGNVKSVHESSYTGPPQRADEDTKICTQTLKQLTDFAGALKSRNINIVFANTPYMTFDGLDPIKVTDSSRRFSAALKHIAPVIDDRNELIFSRDQFFDSVMHLNASGRELRTQRLLARIQAAQLIQQSR